MRKPSTLISNEDRDRLRDQSSGFRRNNGVASKFPNGNGFVFRNDSLSAYFTILHLLPKSKLNLKKTFGSAYFRIGRLSVEN